MYIQGPTRWKSLWPKAAFLREKERERENILLYFQPPYLSYYQLASKVWPKNIILELFKLPNKHSFIFHIEDCF